MPAHLLSWIAFTPSIGALAVLAAPRGSKALLRGLAVAATLVPLVLSTWACTAALRAPAAGLQLVERTDWLLAIRAEYHVGVDGFSLALVWLTACLAFVAVAASRSDERAGKAHFALLLLLETGILGAAVALDLFLLFVFWEAALLPAFFLIGTGATAGATPGATAGAAAGETTRAKARGSEALRSLAYAGAGSALALTAVLALRLDGGTFSIPALAELARRGALTGAHLPAHGALLGLPFGTWCFWFLVVGCALRIPLVPLRAWLADARAEAPTPLPVRLGRAAIVLGLFVLLWIAPLRPSVAQLALLLRGAP